MRPPTDPVCCSERNVNVMKRYVVLAVLVMGLLAGPAPTVRAEAWPCWRGPRGDGTCIEKDVPAQWDPREGLWKTELPGQGHASAIVWGARVLTATALPATQERVLLCLDGNTGDTLWQRTVVQGPLPKLHKENSHASSTPATDGERVYATFRVGDEIIVAAHDWATGEQLWLVRAGTHTGEWGFSNEPVLFRGVSSCERASLYLSGEAKLVLARWICDLLPVAVNNTNPLQCLYFYTPRVRGLRVRLVLQVRGAPVGA